MQKTKKPPLRKTVDLRKLDDFAAEGAAEPKSPELELADKKTKTKSPAKYPWEKANVRTDVIKGMGVPLSEPYLLKLRFIAKHTIWSQRKFCQAKLEEAIDKEIKTLVRKLD